MRKTSFILIPLFFLCTSFDNPCSKKIVKDSGTVVFIYYPSCKDSSRAFVRTFEKGILANEVWINGNRPAGFENFYSMDKGNVITATNFWGVDQREFSISYFAKTGKPKRILQLLVDSTYFDLHFYSNGNIKAYGLTNSSYCNFGIWTEIDSLGLTSSSGKYKIVQKEHRTPSDNCVIVEMWCYEKDSIWTMTDSQGKILEKKVFSNGALKSYH